MTASASLVILTWLVSKMLGFEWLREKLPGLHKILGQYFDIFHSILSNSNFEFLLIK